MATLSSIATFFSDGNWIESKDQSENGIRLVQTGNIGIGEYLDKSERAKYISEETFEALKCTEIFEGDILISRLPDPVGRSCLLPNIGKAITAVDCSILRVNKNVCNPKYIVYYTQSEVYQSKISQFLAGTTRTRISRKNLEKIEVNLPSLAEQNRIVAILEKVDTLISDRKEQLNQFNQLVKSRFIELFNRGEYPAEKLDDNVIEMFIGPFGSSLKNECFVDKSDSFCMVYEQKHAIQKTMAVPTRYVSKSKYDELQRFTVLGGDIIVSCRGTIGEIFVVPENAPIGIMHPSIMKIRLNKEKYNQKFFVFALAQYMDEHSAEANGSGIKMAVSATVLGQALFEVPPISVQNEFAAFVEHTDKLKLAVTEALTELETLKKSLMQQYFG